MSTGSRLEPNVTQRIDKCAEDFTLLLRELARGGHHPELDVAFNAITTAKLHAKEWAATQV